MEWRELETSGFENGKLPIPHIKLKWSLAWPGLFQLKGQARLLDARGFPRPRISVSQWFWLLRAINRGKRPEVDETVRFLHEHCMMEKVHSGVVVHSEEARVGIEGIDLKVW